MLAGDVAGWSDLLKISKEESFSESPNVLEIVFSLRFLWMLACILKYSKRQLFGEREVPEVWLGLNLHKDLL